MMDWEWWGDINTFRLFMTILLLANWEDTEWRGKTIKRGSFWTSIQSLAKSSQQTIQQTKTALNKLIATNEITSEATSQGRLITVVNYEFYQDGVEKATNELTNKLTNGVTNGATNNLTTTKEYKKYKNNKNIVVSRAPKSKKEFWSLFSPDDIDAIYNVYPNSAGHLIDEVATDVVKRKAVIKLPVRYVLGYAKRKNWNDNTHHFEEV